MELTMDPHHALMATVLCVHFLGVAIVAVAAALSMVSLFVVIMTVHTIRCLWALTRRPAKAAPRPTFR
jgi:hypothetical protein